MKQAFGPERQGVFMRVFSISAILCAAVVTASGCMSSQNSVRLLYNPEQQAVVSATAPRVAVVRFVDARNRSDIGVKRDGSPLAPASSVVDWVSGSVADALSRRGAMVSVVYDRRQAEAGNPDRIIEGAIDEVWLREKSMNSYEAVVRIQARVEGGASPAVTRRFVSKGEKTGIPGSRLAEETLSSTLADVLDNFCSSTAGSLR